MAAPKIPADLRRAVDAIVNQARKKMQAGAELGTMALVDAPSTGSVVGVPMAGPSGAEKDAWARAVRTVSAFADARFVLLVSEMWMTNADSKEELDRLRAQYGEVRLMPGRRDGVFFQLETHDGIWQGEAEVKPFRRGKVEGARTFGVIELKMPAHSEGRVVGLLASKRRPGN